MEAQKLRFLPVNVRNRSQMTVVNDLVWEYFQWGNTIAVARYGFDFDIAGMLDEFIGERYKYLPPSGRLHVAELDGVKVGVGGFKQVAEDTCELKRVYVRGRFRGRGTGRALVEKLIADARDEGYRTMRLESATFMDRAYRLYTNMGFTEIDIYEGVESPEEYRSMVYCMELDLRRRR